MLNLSSIGPLSDGVISKLSSGIPNKTKFVVGWLPEKLTEAPWFAVHPPLSEALRVAVCHFDWLKTFTTLLPVILNKRWQTLDLVSMVDEFKRSVLHDMGVRDPSLAAGLVKIKDTLSSLPRFKREKDLS